MEIGEAFKHHNELKAVRMIDICQDHLQIRNVFENLASLRLQL